MNSLPSSAIKLIDNFSKLPGIGRKTAQRLVFHLLSEKASLSFDLSNALKAIKNEIINCKICHSITEVNPCKICSDDRRDPNLICLVESPYDVFVLENSIVLKVGTTS